LSDSGSESAIFWVSRLAAWVHLHRQRPQRDQDLRPIDRAEVRSAAKAIAVCKGGQDLRPDLRRQRSNEPVKPLAAGQSDGSLVKPLASGQTIDRR
jgi:hypothetical protein